MKNKNLSLACLMLSLWTNCGIDQNATTDTTTLTSPDGNASVTVPTDDYDWILEEFPAETEAVLAEHFGNEELVGEEKAAVVAENEAE